MGQATTRQWKQRSKTKNKKQFSLSIPIITVKSSNTSSATDGSHLFFSVHERKNFWSLSLIGSDMNSVAETCCITVHTKGHGILSTSCPCGVSHEVQQVELRATCRRDRMSPKLMLRNYDCISSHEGTCRCNMSLRHVPATFSCVCKRYDFVPATCPCYTSLLHVPSECTTQIFAAALCRCDMSLLHDPLPTFMILN